MCVCVCVRECVCVCVCVCDNHYMRKTVWDSIALPSNVLCKEICMDLVALLNVQLHLCLILVIHGILVLPLTCYWKYDDVSVQIGVLCTHTPSHLL